jgi:hypothetical protein
MFKPGRAFEAVSIQSFFPEWMLTASRVAATKSSA